MSLEFWAEYDSCKNCGYILPWPCFNPRSLWGISDGLAFSCFIFITLKNITVFSAVFLKFRPFKTFCIFWWLQFLAILFLLYLRIEDFASWIFNPRIQDSRFQIQDWEKTSWIQSRIQDLRFKIQKKNFLNPTPQDSRFKIQQKLLESNPPGFKGHRIQEVIFWILNLEFQDSSRKITRNCNSELPKHP